MESCPYCGSSNVILKENGEYVCATCGSVLGVRYDEGYGDSPSMTRREYFAQFQPGNTTRTSDLRARLQLLKLEKSMREFSKDEVIEYIVDTILKPIREIDLERARLLKLEIIQQVRNIIEKVHENEPIFYIYAIYAIAHELGIYVSNKKLREIIRKFYEDIPKPAIRRVKKILLELGYSLVFNVNASIVLYGQVLGLGNIAIARALREASKYTSTYPVDIVLRVLYNAGADITKLAKLLELTPEKAYQHIQKTNEKTMVRSRTMLDHDHSQNGPAPDHDYEVELHLWRKSKEDYVIFSHKLKRAVEIQLSVDDFELRFKLKWIKLKKQRVIGAYINKTVGELLYRRFGNGPIKARVVSWSLESESSQE